MGWVFQPYPLFSELQHRSAFPADILAALPMGTWGQNAQSLFHTTCSQPTLCHLAGMSPLLAGAHPYVCSESRPGPPLTPHVSPVTGALVCGPCGRRRWACPHFASSGCGLWFPAAFSILPSAGWSSNARVSVISKIPVVRLHYVPPTPRPTPLFTAGHVAFGLLCAGLRLLSLTHFQASRRGCQLPVSPEAAAVRVPGKGSATTSTPPLCSAHPDGTVCAPPLGTTAWDSALLAPLLLHWGGEGGG